MRPVARGARVRSATRAERRKLAARVPLRLLAAACLLGPFAFALVVQSQSGAPSDALFGIWVHTSSFATTLVILGFAGSWGFPIVAGVLAGDLFSSEDRLGTWPTILTRSRRLDELFAGKVLAAATFAVGLGVLLAVASILAGLVVAGAHPMVDLSGRVLSAGHLLALVAASWLISLLPVLAYTSLAILFSVASRNGILGVLGPILVALLTQLLALIGKGTWIHLLLIGSAFDAWHGLFVAKPFFGPLVVSIAVCVAWIAGTLGASWVILRRREFTAADASLRRAGWKAPVRIAGATIVVVGLLVLGTNLGPAGVTQQKLSQSIDGAFRRLTILQQDLLGHPIPASAQYRIVPICRRRNATPVGPGDWSCTMNVYILLARGTQPLTDTPVGYDVSVQSNGCYKAQSPPLLVGQAVLHDTHHQTVVNPIATIYGCFNIL